MKAIHGVCTKVRDVLKAMDDRMKGIEDMLQGRLQVE